MKVPLEIERTLTVPADYARVRPLLDNIEQTIGRFPKLRRLKKLGPDDYLWEMQTIGSRLARIAHEVSYAAHYRIDAEQGRLSWTPLKDYGNASIEGTFQLQDMGPKTALSFRVKGELRDVPVPLMYRLMAQPFIQGKFTRLVETFLERTSEALLADEVAAATPTRSRKKVSNA